MDTSDVIALAFGLVGALFGAFALYHNHRSTRANDAMVAANRSMANANERMARSNEDLVRLTEASAASAEKAENIQHLLGEKETVGYAAVRLRLDGLPPVERDRRIVLAALMQACVFEHSDRARALLYKVLEENLAAHRDEIEEALRAIEQTFASMHRYGFTKDQLDLERGEQRLAIVRKVVEAPAGQTTPPAPSPTPPSP